MQFSRDSEWFAPLILGLGTAFVIILIVLLVFIAEPPLRDLSKNAQPVFDLSAEPVDLEIGRLRLRVPRNYIRHTEKRPDNRIKELVLHALLPNMMSYQEKNWWMFEDKTPTSRLVQMRFLHKEAAMMRHSAFFMFMTSNYFESARSSAGRADALPFQRECQPAS